MTDKLDTNEHLNGKKLEILFHQSTFTFLFNGLVAILMVMLFWTRINQSLLSLWFVTYSLILTSRLFLTHWFNSGKLQNKSYRWWFTRYNIGAFITGIMWCSLVMYICYNDSFSYSAVALLAIGGLVAGSVAIYCVSFQTFIAFSVPALTPISVYFLFQSNMDMIFLGIMSIVYLGTMTTLSYQLNKMIFRYFSYEPENINLLSKLEREKKWIARLNNDLQSELSKQKRIEIELKKEKLKAEDMAQKLLKLSSMDGLTGIYNRRYFDEFLGKEWSRSSRSQLPTSLIMCDVDYFKAYNDHYGHQAGDQCLRKVASLMADHTRRPGDIAARYGGEEFGIILSNTNQATAIDIAEQIRQAIEDLAIEHKMSKNAYCVTVSFGVATMLPNRNIRSTSLISRADKSLYRAKLNGRNCVTGAAMELITANKSSA